jgi:uncharacterized membrane protein YfcA
MTFLEALALAGAAFAAGAINAVAGGGTLITFPALIFLGTTERVANATSTLALVFGTAGSIFGFRKQIAGVRPWLMRFLPVSLIGGWIGSVLLTHTSNEAFRRLVPCLLLFATVLFISQGAFRRFAGLDAARPVTPHRVAVWAAIAFQFVVAIYGGYFGAGIGILMLASLGFMGLTDIYQMNTVKNVLGSLINVVAAVWFVYAGLIDWPKTGVMTAGALGGYFIGAHYSLKIPQARVRQIISGIGLIISAVLFWRQMMS